ncbi:MAG: hypothetical protein DME26_04525 [Verrucomicrobia bacterium]|nr:MAG: hypothetical protein DME26_04525 [Verrucomicrobiota bacterium]
MALKSDGTVFAFGLHDEIDVPAGLNNVVSIAVEGNSSWAIKRDGTATRWGNGDEDYANIVSTLSNITAIAWAGYRTYLALKNDGTALGFRFDTSDLIMDLSTGLPTGPLRSPIYSLTVRGRILSNI